AFLASRAESDGLALFANREKKVRNAAAASRPLKKQRPSDWFPRIVWQGDRSPP
ncbi:MAG: hypothetical protein ACI8QC_003772, partial [Planctomycetota bacterium]